MIGDFLRGLAKAITQPDQGSGYDARLLPRLGWECECGARSTRPGSVDMYDAKRLAQEHQWRSGVGHPMPVIVHWPAPGIPS
jgi:hypothetical protein